MHRMSDPSTLIDRDAVLTELRKVFDPPTAEVVLNALDQVAAQLRKADVNHEGLRELRDLVAQLAAAQVRAEERAGAVELALEELASAQRRTTEAVADLTGAMDRLRKQVGGLSESLGGDIEDVAYIVLHEVLKREYGWEVGVLERSWETWDGEPEEINVFGVASDPANPGRTIWIVGEAKHNLTAKEVRKFARQVERARRHLMGDVFPVCFCYRARPEVQQMIKDAGLRLVFSYGKIV
jgi:hypothetical protein